MVRYPASAEGRWGIGRHSDYGLWTMIVTDAAGLEFLHPEHGWARVPHIHGGIVMNAGDVLDRLSGGHLRSAYHRARNLSATSTRLSLPFFYDPDAAPGAALGPGGAGGKGPALGGHQHPLQL